MNPAHSHSLAANVGKQADLAMKGNTVVEALAEIFGSRLI